MSYDVHLTENDVSVKVKWERAGSTISFGVGKDGRLVQPDSMSAWFNLTWNHGDFFRQVFGENGIRTLDGMKAGDTIEMLRSAIKVLGTDTVDDYWAIHPGNAGKSLETMLHWAEQKPEAIWRIN